MPNDSQAYGAVWTVLKTVQWTTDYFERNGIESPRADAETLLAYSLKCQRIDLYLNHDQPLTSEELERFKQLILRRAKGEPVAYIQGYKEFWSMRFRVTPDVLIPRPDTECVVETALAVLPQDSEHFIVEMGVGSGALSVALAKERAACQFLVTDRSFPAVSIAHENAITNGVAHQFQFLVANWMEAFAEVAGPFDMVISNPPYIARSDMDGLPRDVRDFEPCQALDGGKDGLQAIREIVLQASLRLKPGGFLILEIGYDQGMAVRDLVRSFSCYEPAAIHQDLAGHDRVAKIRKKGS